MEGFQILIYVAVAIFYIYTAIKKNAKKADEKRKDSASDESGSSGEINSFEELIKQLKQGGNQPTASVLTKNQQELERIKKLSQNKPQENRTLESNPMTSSNVLGKEETEGRLKKVFDDKEAMLQELSDRKKRIEENSFKTYDQNVDELVRNFEATPIYKNEANEVDYENPLKSNYKGLNDGKGRFDVFNQQEKAEHPLMKVFRNPQEIRTAFLIGEIFQRKYE